ncbi:MAG: thiol-disulfide oxidoreductase DCC family protein [Flavobacteriaceae bacterium]
MNTVLIFDGHCTLCDFSVQFIKKFTRDSNLRFTSNTSDASKRILLQVGEKKFKFDSIVLYKEGELLYKSDVLKYLILKTPVLYPFCILLLLPKPFQDSCYDYIAENRYRWFKPLETCKVPKPEERHLFLD